MFFPFISVSMFLIFASFCLNASASTVPAEDPAKFCDKVTCSQPMLAITASYQLGDASFSRENLSAYSGACYHLHPAYNPTYPHYGVKTFRRDGDSITVSFTPNGKRPGLDHLHFLSA